VESKSGTIRRVNSQKNIIVIIATLSASIALADDFKTVDGKEYKDATVTNVEPDGIVIKTKSGTDVNKKRRRYTTRLLSANNKRQITEFRDCRSVTQHFNNKKTRCCFNSARRRNPDPHTGSVEWSTTSQVRMDFRACEAKGCDRGPKALTGREATAVPLPARKQAAGVRPTPAVRQTRSRARRGSVQR
jgi:hypothetical protein